MGKHASVDLKIVAIQGKKFNWKRPQCSNGCRKMWGHGFTLRYFSGFSDALFIKKYRCPTCHAVVTMIPDQYWPQFQTSITEIYNAINIRLSSYKWPSWVTRQRAGHWMRKFITFIKMNYNLEEIDFIQKLKELHSKQIPFLG